MGPAISDYNKRLIQLFVIQLSGGHCNTGGPCYLCSWYWNPQVWVTVSEVRRIQRLCPCAHPDVHKGPVQQNQYPNPQALPKLATPEVSQNNFAKVFRIFSENKRLRYISKNRLGGNNEYNCFVPLIFFRQIKGREGKICFQNK